jgi:Zn-dependent protease with chaperone function
MKIQRRNQRVGAWLLSVLLLLTPLAGWAQGTRISAPKNSYSPADDVKVGQQGVAEITRQLPLLAENSSVDNYVESVGRRLVAAIPRQFQHPQFRYSFSVVNARDINAFALPGGPMFVNRGMIEAARTEGEMAGVMAHEISHVALRHGTAQATKQSNPGVQIGAIGGAILGAIIGGNVGGIISQGTQIGLSAYLLKYSREYETQADILGAQIMARAGYDPRDLANMFRTIEQQGGGSGPEWLSSHPNPGNRFERINEEARLLRVSNSRGSGNTAQFNQIQTQLRRMAPAPTMEEAARSRQSRTSNNSGSSGRRYPANSRIANRIELPASDFRTYRGGNAFRVSVPANWREFPENNSITFAPEGAYGDYQGQPVFTHGAIAGVTDAGSRDLRSATDAYINALLQNNSYLQAQGGYRQTRVDGRTALALNLRGVSKVTGQEEVVTVYTSMLRNGALFYLINVAPQTQYSSYTHAFQTMLNSVQLNG